MKTSLIVLITLMLSSFSVMATEKNINQGNYELGGSISLSTVSNTANSTYLSVSPKLQYFFWDNISVGGTLKYYTYTDTKSYGIGPSLSYYFWTKEKFAFFVSQTFSLDYSKYSNPSYSTNTFIPSSTNKSGKSAIGVNYFLNPSIAVGLTANYYYSLESDSSYKTKSLKGSFKAFF